MNLNNKFLQISRSKFQSKYFHQFLFISTYFNKFLSKYFHKFLSQSFQSKYFNIFHSRRLYISIYFYLFLSISFNAFSAKLTVPDSLIAGRTLYLVPQASAPASPQAGEIYYDSVSKTPKYYNGTAWIDMTKGGGDKSVASVIVAAKDSLDTVLKGSIYENPRADFTCQGTNDQVAIQQAIDSLGSSGGAVYLLEGTYNLNAAINLDDGIVTGDGIDDSNKSIIGAGSGTKLLISQNFIYSISVKNCRRVLISSLRIIARAGGVD